MEQKNKMAEKIKMAAKHFSVNFYANQLKLEIWKDLLKNSVE
jgi:hypothetical protein